MKIICFLEDRAVVKRILVHSKLWDAPERSPPLPPALRDFIYDPDFFRGLVN